MKKILLANKAGFCFGVKNAVDKALNARKNQANNKTIYTLGPLIHNKDVVNYLKSENICSIEYEDINSLHKNDIIIIRSHGTTPQIINKLKEKNLTIIDATCPHVSKIHEEVNRYYELNYNIIIVGDCNHPEVIGINGWCDNTGQITKDGSNIQDFSKKVCIVCQTTEKQDNFEKVVLAIASKCRKFVAINTICNATHVRQKAATDLSNQVDTMIVIGGYHSSNTTKLYELCKQNCKNTIHVENSKEITDKLIENSEVIGITAGASTPDWIIKDTISKINKF